LRTPCPPERTQRQHDTSAVRTIHAVLFSALPAEIRPQQTWAYGAASGPSFAGGRRCGYTPLLLGLE